MGRLKKGFNWRARQSTSGTLSNAAEVSKLNEGIQGNGGNKGIDDPNALVLPSEKRTLKRAKGVEPQGKILSRKKRKLLEKIVDQKKKKEERGDLISKLKEVIKELISIGCGY